ncbi:hypothetical protein [Flavobacterium cerinum]|uniref:Uncharacterized protein n=1 Tax=Flavobacterium cerinum TaxID=2502784 RepID=A0ABY5IP01_9FLAO|nr:hypothetical protein [Flavobacterium cerinum]UUC44566.1 hypothetical protein NOX80_13100 [Flavobacterium cerinum]
MKNTILFYFLFGMITIGFGQELSERKTNYDLDIMEYLDKSTDQETITFQTFLTNSKPFSKWDARPVNHQSVWLFNTIHKSSEVPNFIYGIFSVNKYNITKDEALKMPNQFLAEATDKKSVLIEHLKGNVKKFQDVSKLIGESDNTIFLNQSSQQRIDNLYKENDKYWQYKIPSDSPFPMSNTIETNLKASFSKKQVSVLNLLKELNVYAAIKTTKGIFYLADGLTDNSYGFYFTGKGAMETDNHLFEIIGTEKINENFYYYIAN